MNPPALRVIERTPFPTFADALLRWLVHTPRGKRFDQEGEIINAMRKARRFVLDKSMSAYLADLSLAPLCSRSSEKRCGIIEEMRKLARLPFETTWIEMDLYSFERRAWEEYKSCSFAHDVIFDENPPGAIGWLIRRKNDTSFIATPFCSGPARNASCLQPEPGYFEILLMPEYIGFAWSTDDAPMPWQEYRYRTPHAGGSSEALTGIKGYKTSQLIAVPTPYSHLLDAHEDADHFCCIIGDARKLWALLATINDIPVTIGNIAPKTSGLARHLKYKRQLGHSVIHLTVPQKQWHMSAKRLIAAIRKRAHGVRGHWRNDHWRPGKRIWIRDHVRGDASLGELSSVYEVRRA